MSSTIKILVATFALLLSAFFSSTAAAATAPAKVAFVGDWLTDSWSATFSSNWVFVGNPNTSNLNSALPQMPAAIALKPSIIHIMVGSEYWNDDASYNIVTGWLQEDLIPAIMQAQAAHIPVIIGIEPQQCTGPQGLPEAALEVYAVATKYGVPIINYSGAFSNGQTGYNGSAYGTSGGTAALFGGSGNFFTSTNTGTSLNIYSAYQPTAAGYAIMTMMARTAFATLNAQPRSLYLQDEEAGTPNGGVVTSNVNTVSPGNTVQFYSVISYTNGVTGVGFNTNFLTGTNGTWTSSNPLVGIVNQYGQFWAFNEGTTTVKFALPNGVWNEWIMYVGAPFAG